MMLVGFSHKKETVLYLDFRVTRLAVFQRTSKETLEFPERNFSSSFYRFSMENSREKESFQIILVVIDPLFWSLYNLECTVENFPIL